MVLLVALGGAVGSVARHALTVAAPSDRLATLLVNLLGSLAIGVLVARVPTGRLRALLGTGFLGGFTTMSAVAVDAATSDLLPALSYLAATLVGGVALCRVGLHLGNRAAPRPSAYDGGDAP